MFGERRNLILPIIFDIANIVKKSSAEEDEFDRFDHILPVNNNNEFMIEKNEGHTVDLHRMKRATTKYHTNDKLSYHERKLNMTDFRGTAESNDQHAVESETSVQITLPNLNSSKATILSLEEIENLALRDLNGTIGNGNVSSNVNLEDLPEPEMLILPYRVRPKPISERFDNIYLYVIDYPM